MPVKKVKPVPSDIDIAHAAELIPIREMAAKLDLVEDNLDLYGKYKAKVHLDVIEKFKDRPQGKYIDVTAITPTPLGEGKTTTTVGLTEAMGSELGKNVMCCIRQPSMGPTFNIKGGAAGGGYSQIIPMEDFNLHMTGDIHAISVAHNLVAAAIDTRMYHESRQSDEALARRGVERRLDIDPETITWNRVVDICDRSLREIEVGLNDAERSEYFPRKTGYDITVASEFMAILALATSLEDLRERVGKVVFGLDKQGNPLNLEELGIAGAVTVLLRDALMPNLMQTLEGQPAFVHCGPFANIAHGNSSIIADQIAVKLADYVVTESGFGADIGMEKFFDIKCRYSGLIPDAVVLVATVRALKMGGGVAKADLGAANVEAVKKGCANLGRHIENLAKFGVPAVVGINHFVTDTDEEIEAVKAYCAEKGVDAVLNTHWANGGKGITETAEKVVEICESGKAAFKPLYPDEMPLLEKVETIAKEIYRADGVVADKKVRDQLKAWEDAGYGNLPVCMAKTQYSFTTDPSARGAPTGFDLPVREVRLSAGAGFVVVICGEIMTMPGLPRSPAAEVIKLNAAGEIEGLF